jgi:hypothetical protein
MPRGNLPQIGRDILPPGDLAPYNRLGTMPYAHRGDTLMVRRALMGPGMGMDGQFDPWSRRNLPSIGGHGPHRGGFPVPVGGFGSSYGGGTHGGAWGCGYPSGFGRAGLGRSRRRVAMPWSSALVGGVYGPRLRGGVDYDPRFMMDPRMTAARRMGFRSFEMPHFGQIPRLHRRPKRPPLYVAPEHTRHRFGHSGFPMGHMDMGYDDEYDDDMDDEFYPPTDYDDDLIYEDDEDGYPHMDYGHRRGMHGGRYDYDD